MEPLSHARIRRQGRYADLSVEGLTPDVLRGLFRSMLRLRRCEEALIERYRRAEEMKCPVHFTLGQEAVPAALSLLVQPDDYLFSHHRCHGYFLAKHAPMRAFFAELFGKATGANGGLAGSQEISMPSSNFFSGAILTGASSIAVGSAFAFKHRGTTQIAIAGFGEAATEEGIFWEGLTYASVKKLPLVFLCENNLYSMYSAQVARQPGDDISRRVASFGVETHTLFGNDAPAAYRALSQAVQHARSGAGPVFLEFYTYRLNAHVGPEPDDHINYRTADEIEFWKTNDPIALLEEKLIAAGLLADSGRQAMIAEIDSEIADAFEFASSSPFPTDVDLEALNRSPSSPVAERLLGVSTHGEFDENQATARLAPY
jgi:pyruvate dehydrogenase E1 component alpha subunit